MRTLAERLRHALDSMDPPRKQADLVKACGLKGPSVSNWFTGETKSLKADSAILAADFLGVRPQWLIDGTGPMRPPFGPALGIAAEPPARYGAGPSISEALSALATALREVSPELREALAANLAGWARSGSADPWRGLVEQLLTAGRSGKRTGTTG